MKRKNQPTRRTLSLSADALPRLSDGKPPAEFRIFRAGANPSDYGDIVFDEKAAEMVMAEYERKGNPLFFDWNHGHDLPKDKRTRESGASAGEFKLEVRAGELWATGCEWTADAYEDLEKRRYNLFSPTFPVDDTDGVIRPCGLMGIAILNRAGLDHLDRIAAGAADTNDERDDDMKTAEQIQAELDTEKKKVLALEGEVATLKSKGGVLALAAIVGVSAEAEVGPAVTALVKVRRDVLALAGVDSADDAIVTLRAWKDSHGKVAGLVAAEEKRAQLALEAAFDEIVEQGVKELKIGGGEVTASWKAAQLEAMGGKLTDVGVAATKKLVAMMAPMGKAPGTGPKQPSLAKEPGELTEKQKAFLALHGVKEETALAAIAAEKKHALSLEAQNAGR